MSRTIAGCAVPASSVPPIQNAGDGLTNRGADKTGKGRLTIAEDRDGAPRLPPLLSFFFKRLCLVSWIAGSDLISETGDGQEPVLCRGSRARV